MADHMNITLDGIPVNVDGLALPYGDSEAGEYLWWNAQLFVIQNVTLEAGVHTFKCDAKAAGGLNVSSMTIKSSGAFVERSVEFTGADIDSEDGKVYYLLSFVNKGYSMDEIKLFNEVDGVNYYYDLTCEVVDGITTIKADISDIATSGVTFYPHMTLGIANVPNGKNFNGDVYCSTFTPEAHKCGDYYLELYLAYSMPAIRRVTNAMSIVGADLIEEDGKIYYTLTYKMIGYDPANVEFFDNGTIYEVVAVEQNGLNYTFKIDPTKYGSIWPHLRVNGQMWDGANNTSSGNGDVKISVTEKSITYGGKVYTIKNQYSMPTIVVSAAS
jgi:hypothetical protein